MTCDKRPDELNKMLQWNFFSLIVGGPGSGKTNLLLNLISNRSKKNRFYYKMFHDVWIFSPSFHTVKKKIGIDEDHIIPFFDMGTLQAIIDSIPDDQNTLIIFDDMVADLKTNLKPMLKIVYNRRHIGAGLSVIITSQKYNKIPKEIRCGASSVFMFNNSKTELNALYEELSNLDRWLFDKIATIALKNKHDFLYIKSDEPDDMRYHHNFNKICIEE